MSVRRSVFTEAQLRVKTENFGWLSHWKQVSRHLNQLRAVHPSLKDENDDEEEKIKAEHAPSPGSGWEERVWGVVGVGSGLGGEEREKELSRVRMHPVLP